MSSVEWDRIIAARLREALAAVEGGGQCRD